MRGVRVGGCRGGRALKQVDYGGAALGQAKGAHASSVRAVGAFTLEA
jgi:hypothetical protein